MRTARCMVGVGALLGLALTQGALAFDLQGHRGARGLSPENTLPAFATAVSLGVTTLELDTGITKDGIVVISHNSVLNPDITRDKDGKWLGKPGPAISALTYAELQTYDVGRINPFSNYAKSFPDQKGVNGTRIPKLADLFALVRKAGNTQVRFNIETKLSPLSPSETPDSETFATTVVGIIRDEGMVDRTAIQSFDWRTLQVVQRIAPEIPTVYLSCQHSSCDTIAVNRAEGSPWTAGIQYKDHGSVPKMVKVAGGKIWSPLHTDLSEFKVKEAHDLGLQVVAWTVNDPAQITRMLDFGVDGIITDRPDLVRKIMADRKMPLPPATPVEP
jgi:glycerophosphoryl diester phosphodiesterase